MNRYHHTTSPSSRQASGSDTSPLDQILERLDAQPTLSEDEIQALLATIPPTQRDLVQTYLRVRRQFPAPRESAASATADTAVPASAQTVDMVPFPVHWPEDQRGIPSALLRSALFGVVRRGRRRYLNEEVLAAWPGIEIRYKGERLDQADLDVYLEVLHLAQQHGTLGRNVPCTAYGILKAIGRHTKNRRWLKSAMRRMVDGSIEITVADRYTYVGSLIDAFYYDKHQGTYLVRLNPDLARLFDASYTRLALRIRLQLSGDLAKWLHGYICSHKATPEQPHRIGLDKLRELCGTEVQERYKWRQEVKCALAELTRYGVVQSWQIDNDILAFVRP